ncbi:MAG: hypothetical protein RL386_6 [Bacteroidota bacterium]|jgi:hypothetical protein
MIKIAAVTGQLLAKSPFVAEALEEGLINISALARKLQPEVSALVGRPVKLGAVAMAIQRMSPITGGYPNRALKRFFKKLQDISLRADLLDYTFENSATLPHCQAVLLGEISRHPRTFYSVSRGIAETTLLISRDFEQQVENIFRDEKLISRLEQLSALSLMLPAENRILSGVYYLILRQLAWHGINVVEVVSTSNEFTIVVKESDTQEALAALMQLKRQT